MPGPSHRRCPPSLSGLLAALALGAAGAGAEAPPLRTALEVASLDPAALAAERPVTVRGTVTYYRPGDPADLVVQDETGGLFINDATNALARTLRPGHVVEVTGPAVGGNFSPRVIAAALRLTGTNAPPPPIPATYEDLRSGRLDCRRVEVAAVVQAAEVDAALTPPRLLLRAATPAGTLDAWVLGFDAAEGRRLVDAAVRLRGVALAWENARRQITGVRLLVPSLADVTVTRAADPDPFAAPQVTPDRLLAFRPEGLDLHRVRVRGVVTWWRPGSRLVAQDDGLGFRIQSASRTPLSVGDEIEAAGFPAMFGQTAGLAEAVYRVTGRPGPPAPRRLEPDGALLHELDQALVRAEGTLRLVQRDGPDVSLHLEGRGMNFLATLPSGDAARGPRTPEPGSRVALTGVLELRPSERARRLGGPPDGFGLLLRGPADVAVLAAGPWLNERRLKWIVGAGAGGLALALLWAFTLRRRVERRTAQLAREIRSRHDAVIEFNAALGERERIAAELHDTLQQSLTGAALQLDAAGLALAREPARTERHLGSARDLLARSRSELRRSVWNLRHGEPTRRDLAAELREAVQGLTTAGVPRLGLEIVGEPRPLPELTANHALRIAQEALTNAVRHARAENIRVRLAFAPDALELRVADDGGGFAVARAGGPADGHFGLGGMRERAARLGGKLVIRSEPGRGTTVELSVPADPGNPA